MPIQHNEYEQGFDPENEKSAIHWHTAPAAPQNNHPKIDNQVVANPENQALAPENQAVENTKAPVKMGALPTNFLGNLKTEGANTNNSPNTRPAPLSDNIAAPTNQAPPAPIAVSPETQRLEKLNLLRQKMDNLGRAEEFKYFENKHKSLIINPLPDADFADLDTAISNLEQKLSAQQPFEISKIGELETRAASLPILEEYYAAWLQSKSGSLKNEGVGKAMNLRAQIYKKHPEISTQIQIIEHGNASSTDAGKKIAYKRLLAGTAPKIENAQNAENQPIESEKLSENEVAAQPSPTQILNAMNQKDITFANLYVQTGDNPKAAQLTASDMVKKVAYGADDNGEIEVKKADKNATNTKDKKNKIIIRQTHYFNQAFAEKNKKGGEKRYRVGWEHDPTWKTRVDSEIAEMGLANGEKKYQVVIDGESWEVEFHLKVEIHNGNEEEFKSFMSQNPTANVIQPFAPKPTDRVSEASHSSGRMIGINTNDVPNNKRTVLHEMFHSLGLNHDNHKGDNGMPNLMSYGNSRGITEKNIIDIVAPAVKLAKEQPDKKVKVSLKVGFGKVPPIPGDHLPIPEGTGMVEFEVIGSEKEAKDKKRTPGNGLTE